MRSLWIMRINAAVRALGLKYSTFINKVQEKFQFNRKMLAELAIRNKDMFEKVVYSINVNN